MTPDPTPTQKATLALDIETTTTTPDPVMEPCPCYRCSEPVEVWDADKPGKRAMNDLHDELRPCEVCGRAKSEYVDRYTWGYYECWWCNDRTADSRSERPKCLHCGEETDPGGVTPTTGADR